MKETMKVENDFSCGGVVWDETRKELLMIQVENLAKMIVWTFPKGHPEKGESEEEAARREVCEETGWDCQIKEPLMDIHYTYVRRKIRINKTVRWFLMVPAAKAGDYDKREILNIKWCSLAEAQASVTYEADKDLLNKLSTMVGG